MTLRQVGHRLTCPKNKGQSLQTAFLKQLLGESIVTGESPLKAAKGRIGIRGLPQGK